MREITKEFQETLKVEEQRRAKDTSFEEMVEFIEEMKRKGISKKKEYDLPLRDTIGRGVYYPTKLRG